jgi:Flp pilus assembly protein TadB
VTAAAVGGWVFLGIVGLVAGVVGGAVLSVWVSTLESPVAVRTREEVSRDLPLAVDLLAVCSSVGLPPQHGLAIVGRAVGGVLGTRLGLVSARLALGADTSAQWRHLTADPLLADLGRALERTLESGAPLSASLMLLSDDLRRDRRTELQRRARSVGVKAAGPLAACFLPAFMLVGVVPTVVGGFQHLL